jgi:hypothetical protein
VVSLLAGMDGEQPRAPYCTPCQCLTGGAPSTLMAMQVPAIGAYKLWTSLIGPMMAAKS